MSGLTMIEIKNLNNVLIVNHSIYYFSTSILSHSLARL